MANNLDEILSDSDGEDLSSVPLGTQASAPALAPALAPASEPVPGQAHVPVLAPVSGLPSTPLAASDRSPAFSAAGDAPLPEGADPSSHQQVCVVLKLTSIPGNR